MKLTKTAMWLLLVALALGAVVAACGPVDFGDDVARATRAASWEPEGQEVVRMLMLRGKQATEANNG